MRQDYVVKTKKNYCYYSYLSTLRHDASTNRRPWCSPVVMVVPQMQSISGNSDGTYMLYMAPLMAGMLGLSCRPCGGPRQLKFGDY